MVDEKKLSYKNVVLAIHIIVFVTAIVLVYFFMLYNEKHDGIIRSGKASAEDTADKFNGYMSTSIEAMKLTADGIDHMLDGGRSLEEIKDYIVSQSTAVKNAVSENFTGVYGCVRGEFVSGTLWVPEPGYVAQERPWYIKGVEGKGEVTLLEPYTDVQTGNTMLAAVKLLKDGESVVGVDISLEEIQKITEKAVKDGVSDIELILDDDNCVVARSDINEVGKNYNSFGADTLENKLVSNPAFKVGDYIELDHEGSRYIVYSAQVGRGWKALSIRNASNVFRPLTWILVWTIVIVIIMVIVLAMVFGRMNKKSIEAQRAIAASQAKTAFLSNMSHEIRTPINAIIGMNEMILRETKDEDIREYSGRIRTAGRSLLGLVDEMLKFSENAGISEREQKRFTASSARVLVIDDDPVNLMVFKNLLKNTGINIDVAGSGAEGLALAGANKYDIMFFDHMMPEMDGIETLHRLKANQAGPNISTPVVCLTANVIPGAKEHYLAEGFDPYLTKPIDPPKLEEMVIDLLPREMITFLEAGNEEEPDETVEIPDFIKDIPEIDVSAGIKNNGDAKAYIETLKVYAKMAEKYGREIEGFMEKDDVANATIKIHALKSTSRIIGAAEIGEEAQTLENAGKAGETAVLRERVPSLLERARQVAKQLLPLLEEESTGDSADLPEINMQRYNMILSRIGEYATDCDNAGIEDMLEELKKYNLGSDQRGIVSDILQSLEDFDFDAIAERVKNGAKEN